jgi:hypothetical protein
MAGRARPLFRDADRCVPESGKVWEEKAMGEVAESGRLEEAETRGVPWKLWGPYLSERQWGTVREDYSENGDAWGYFTHDQARSRAYRWGEDGLAGVCDDRQRLCFALALWNGRDPILKERLFGLSNAEGNHGEDVKEYYFYLDSTPTHSYMKYLYKYPQAAYPYDDLVRTNRSRTREEFEYELLDTGVFHEDRYFDVFVEFAKAAPEDLLIRITAANRGPEPAVLWLLPHLWFRNTWATGELPEKPVLRQAAGGSGLLSLEAEHAELGAYCWCCEGADELLFTENVTNTERIFGTPNAGPYVKDAFHRFLIAGERAAVNPGREGTKAAAVYRRVVEAGGAAVVRLRLGRRTQTADPAHERGTPFGDAYDRIFEARIREADAFYEELSPPALSDDQKNVMRQALAGMLWTKQYYYFDVDKWLAEHQAHPLLGGSRAIRNREWFHMVNDDIISMPDKWEYPWYAAWDLAFHTYPLNIVDHAFARRQLDLMLSEVYLHPSGQIPAYEWNFGDVNPPVHAIATLLNFNTERALDGRGDVEYLKSAFQRLLLNFTWWVNRKDVSGRNLFSGGFLGLDNIGVFDRSARLPTGGHLEQADGTAWMALFSQNMLEIALELSLHDRAYEDMAGKFLEHFFWIAAAMDRAGDNRDELWDEEDGFFYDLLRLPDGTAQRLKVQSLVGLLPLCASTVVSRDIIARNPRFLERAREFIRRHRQILGTLHPPEKPGENGFHLLSILDERKLRRVLARMLDEEGFLSPHGIRSLSKWHQDHPFVFSVHGEEHRVEYLPAESNTGMFGGNSNWRGPVWFPVNLLIIRALFQLHLYYGEGFAVECPTGSGRRMTLREVGLELTRRLTGIFLRGPDGRRPVYGGTEKFQSDPHWRDLILFYEYFHGDNGAGLGASHQTGWTGMVARLIQTAAYLQEPGLRDRERRIGTGIYRRSDEERR